MILGDYIPRPPAGLCSRSSGDFCLPDLDELPSQILNPRGDPLLRGINNQCRRASCRRALAYSHPNSGPDCWNYSVLFSDGVSRHVSCLETVSRHTQCSKKQPLCFLVITSANEHQFSQFFRCDILHEIVYRPF